jgi:hypothetical protein
MSDMVLLAGILTGTACLAVGWVWCMLVARKVSNVWLAGIAVVFIFALPVFALKHWDKARWPVVLSVIGFVLTFGFGAFIEAKG